MTPDELVAALDLPDGARVDRRVPKKLLLENGAPTSADKRQIAEGIEELRWIAALKPTTIGVAAYRDAARETLEIAVLRLTLRAGAKASRLTALVHRAVPYLVLLVTLHEKNIYLSLANKRWSQGQAGKTVLDGEIVEANLAVVSDGLQDAFCGALPLTRQPRATLYALYQGWIDTVLSLHAASVTGTFALPITAEHAARRREALGACRELERQMIRLRSAARKETQLSRKVEINMKVKGLESDFADAKARI